jgi:hypothetical protein
MHTIRYSTKLKDALDELKPAFRDVTQGLDLVTRKRAELAPVFMKTFTLWKRETRRPFIAFLHELDKSLPVNDRKAYRVHPAYKAGYYLQQLAENPEAYKRKGVTPLTMVAIAVKSVLVMFKTQQEQRDALAVIMAATRWRERDQKRLRLAVAKAKPVALPGVPRLVEKAKATRAVVLAFEKEIEEERAIA